MCCRYGSGRSFLCMLWVLVCIPCLLCMSCGGTIPVGGRGKAVVVSVGLDYANSEVASLDGTVDDAVETAACLAALYGLRGIPCEVFLMLSRGSGATETDSLYPSAESILGLLNGLEVSEGDIVVFYYSGHGKDEGNRAFLAAGRTEEHVYYTKLYMDELFDALSGLGCSCAAILDCCNAGYAAESGNEERGFAAALKTLFEGRQKTLEELNRVAVVASCRPEQNSLVSFVFTEEGAGESHSLFTIRLLDALGWVHSAVSADSMCGENVYGYVGTDPGSLTVKELFEKTTENWNSSSQIPVMNRTAVPVRLLP